MSTTAEKIFIVWISMAIASFFIKSKILLISRYLFLFALTIIIAENIVFFISNKKKKN
jgi:hypothetical protein